MLAWLRQLSAAAGAAAVLYAATIAVTALTSLVARTPGRRREARQSLALLTARRRSRGDTR